MDYYSYQKENNNPKGERLIVFDEPLTLLNEILSLETPPISLIKVYK